MAYLNGHELFFGVTATVGGSIIGTPQAVSEPKSLMVTELGNYRYNAEQLIADLQGLWDWDDDDVLAWGGFYLSRSGSSGIILKDNYSTDANAYGGEYSVASNTTDTVNVIRSSTAFMISVRGGAFMFFTAKDSSGTEHKCVAASKVGSTYAVYFGADDGTSANTYGLSGNVNAAKRTTASTCELTAFFDETADGLVISDEVFVLRSCPAGKTGLCSLDNKQFYFGNYIALKDGG